MCNKKIFDNKEEGCGSLGEMNAGISVYYETMGLYITGYKEGADHLVEKSKQSMFSANTLVYPIFFLYRQYIELSLKRIIQDKPLTEAKEKGNYPQIHTLIPLWNQVKKVVDELNNEDYISKKEISQSEKTIKRFDEIDPNSFSFRYNSDKKGSRSLEKLDYINIQSNSLIINKIHEVLEKIYVLVDYNC